LHDRKRVRCRVERSAVCGCGPCGCYPEATKRRCRATRTSGGGNVHRESDR
jgi:hypothetical protein